VFDRGRREPSALAVTLELLQRLRLSSCLTLSLVGDDPTTPLP